MLQFTWEWLGRQKGRDPGAARHPSPAVVTCPRGGAASGLFVSLQWQLCVRHSPVAILAATADCLQPRLSQYWHLGFLFLNLVFRSPWVWRPFHHNRLLVFCCSCLGTILSHLLHLRLAFLGGNVSLVSLPPPETHVNPSECQPLLRGVSAELHNYVPSIPTSLPFLATECNSAYSHLSINKTATRCGETIIFISGIT